MTPEILSQLHTAGFADTRGWSAEEFSDFLSDPACFVTGDERAFALGRVVLDEAELLTITTHPDHRRQGHARTTLLDWFAAASEKGAAQAFLEVAADNTAALDLYHSCGFQTTGRRRRYYTRPDGMKSDAITMMRVLAAA